MVSTAAVHRQACRLPGCTAGPAQCAAARGERRAPAAARSRSRYRAGCQRCRWQGGAGRHPLVPDAQRRRATVLPSASTLNLAVSHASFVKLAFAAALSIQTTAAAEANWQGLQQGMAWQGAAAGQHLLDALGGASGIRVEQLVSRLQLRRPVAVVGERACEQGAGWRRCGGWVCGPQRQRLLAPAGWGKRGSPARRPLHQGRAQLWELGPTAGQCPMAMLAHAAVQHGLPAPRCISCGNPTGAVRPLRCCQLLRGRMP